MKKIPKASENRKGSRNLIWNRSQNRNKKVNVGKQ